MFQVMSRFLPSRPQLTLSEDEIRDLCGGAFARADFLQREGNVTAPVASGHQLRAAVRGIWRRMHHVEITINGNRPVPSCDRDGATFCPHVGAVLLHWLRANESFSAYSAVPEADDDWVRDEFDDDDWDEWEALRTPGEAAPVASEPFDSPEPDATELTDELISALSMSTIAQLRELAKRRGVRVTGNKKNDILIQLAAGLVEPANVDAALASLSADDRLILDAIHLMAIARPAPERLVADTARELGLPVSVKVPERVQALVDLALVELLPSSPFVAGGYVIPMSVSARLPAIIGLLPDSAVSPLADHAPHAHLDLMELLLVVVNDIERQLVESGMESVFTSRTDELLTGTYVPRGFRIHPDENLDMTELFPRLAGGERPTIRLVPIPPLLQQDVLDRLATRTSQPPAAVAFVSELMLALQIPVAATMMNDRDERLRRLLALSPLTRAQMFAGAWYTLLGSAESWLLFSDHGRLRVSWKPRYGSPRHGLVEAVIEGMRLIARIVGRLPAGVAFDTAALTRLVIRLVPSSTPSLARLHQTRDADTDLVVSIVESDGAAERPLTLASRDDWEIFIGEIVEMAVSQPLRWLGHVDAGPDGPGGHASWFRVRPSAGVLAGREVPVLPNTPPAPIQIDDDMTVFVPPGTNDPTIHALLARAGDLIEGSATGLRYRLMPDGVREFFDTGASAKQFVDGLEQRAGVPAPATVRQTIERWGAGFGVVRLYDEMTLIELSDDVLVHELRAATSLGSAVLHAFSPRVIAVKPESADRMLSDLTARGYAPRVIEES